MKKIVIFTTIILVTAFVFFLAITSPRNIETNYEDIRSLEVNKSDILLQIDSLEREYDLKMNGMALSFILFYDFDSDYFDEVTSLLDKNGYYGTLILSKECFPTNESYLTIDEFNSLIKKGWNYCILYDNPEQFDYLHRLFEVNGMKTDTVYFNKGKYHRSIDDKLLELGYKSIIHHGENSLNLYKDTINNGIWHIGSMGLVGTSPKAKLLEAVDVNGAFAYTISFDKNHKEEYYDYDTLNLVMDSFNTLVNKKSLKVTDPERGYNYKQEIKNDYLKNKEEYDFMKQKLETELSEIEKQIEEIESE